MYYYNGKCYNQVEGIPIDTYIQDSVTTLGEGEYPQPGVDNDGVLQTSKFVETRKEETTARRNTSITTARRGNTIQSIAPTESVTGVVVEMAPGGGSRTGQPQ